ncbi:MAG: VOC family protein [Clostridium sp.]|nr:VOC family protein [Clostridium sp.]
MKIHHVGYLVKKIEKAIRAFEGLGYNLIQDVILDEYRQVNICFLKKDGYVVELVSPISKESVVADLLKKIGNTPYHICYEVEDMKKELDSLLEQHYVLCSDLHRAIAIDNRNVCFLIHPYLGMIELLEM